MLTGSSCVFAGGYDEQCWRQEYVITDHLGNTRLRLSDLDGNSQIDSTELLSTHDYYPFGLEWQAGGYRYTYNGKEIDRELGLKWHHYGKRMYDAVIARFTGVDPISDQFAWVSTYNYAENEPIANIDLHGLQKSSFQNWLQSGLEWLGLDWNTVSKGPKSQEHANQISDNRGKFEALGEGAETLVGLQSMLIPGMSLVNPNASGPDIVLDLGTSFIPGVKLGKSALKSPLKSLVSATANKAKELVDNFTKSQRGPVLSGVLDSKTGEMFFGINDKGGAVPNLHPILQNRLDDLVKRTNGLGNRPHYRNEIPGSHSEISALNQALWARGNVSISDLNQFIMHNRSLRGGTKVSGVPPRCKDCNELTQGVKFIY